MGILLKKQCCCGVTPGCWYKADICPCEGVPEEPPIPYIRCEQVQQEAIIFSFNGLCWTVTPTNPVGQIPPDGVEVDLTGVATFVDCETCCGCDDCNDFCGGDPPAALSCRNMLQITISGITARTDIPGFCGLSGLPFFDCNVTNQTVTYMMARPNPILSPCNWTILNPGEEFGSTDRGCCLSVFGGELFCLDDRWRLNADIRATEWETDDMICATDPDSGEPICSSDQCSSLGQASFLSQDGSGCSCPDEVTFTFNEQLSANCYDPQNHPFLTISPA